MKIIVAHTGDSGSQPLKACVRALEATLVEAGHQVEQLKLPRPQAGDVSAAIASHRLMVLDPWCDALICLDAFSAVLKHRRKLLWLLAHDFLPGDEANGGTAERFVGNVIRAACKEAGACFAPSKVARRELGKSGFGKVALLAPPIAPEEDVATQTAAGQSARRAGSRPPKSKRAQWAPLLEELGA